MSLLAFYGFILTISLSGVMSPGPLTAFLIARGKGSPWAGIPVTIGHAIAEVPLILALFAGLRPLFEVPGMREGVSLAGGCVLLLLGSAAFRTAPAAPLAPGDSDRSGALAGGVLLTALNPYWVVWWLTVGTNIIARTGAFGWLAGLVGMIAVHLLADAAWAVFITWSAHRGSRMIGEVGWRRIERGCAWVMLGFGAFFLVDGLMGLLA